MKKITELTEVRMRTVESIDAYGTRRRDYTEYDAKRPVRTARSGLRFVNYLVDGTVFYILMFIVSTFFDLLTAYTKFNPFFNLAFTLSAGIMLLGLYPIFYVFCEYKWQRTPGKFLTKTIVIDEYGYRPELRAIILRTVIRFVPFEPFSCMGDEHSYGWHDSWSNTWVVGEDELNTIRQLQSEQS